MRNALLIAKREYLEQVRGRAFKLTTIMIPAAFALILAIGYISGKNSGVGKHIVVAAADSGLVNEIRTEVLADKDAKATVDVTTDVSAAAHQELIQHVDAKAIDGFVWVDEPANAAPTVTYESHASGDFATAQRLSSAVNRALYKQRLAAHGLPQADTDKLLERIELVTKQIKNGKEVTSNALTAFLGAYVMAFLLTFTTMFYGLNVGRSVIQEKTSRIFEVMLATVKPTDMLAGKLVGVGAVGLTQIAIWAVAGGAFASSALGAQLLAGKSIQIPVAEVVLFAVYFVLGYLLYSSVFAGLGATVETEQELQQFAPLAAVPVWLSFSMISFILSDPNSLLAVTASLFPPTAPIVMFLRMGSQFPPMWQIVASIVLMVLAVWAVLFVTAKLYRVGVLMYGKRATLPEMLKWLRYS